MSTLVQRHQGTVTITLPIRTVSEANQREHWATRWKRKLQQQRMVQFGCGAVHGRAWRLDCAAFHVTFTRIVPPRGRRMDQDNYAGSWKHIQDAVAHILGVDDGDVDRVEWVYAPQERGDRYAVRIEVRQRGEVAA